MREESATPSGPEQRGAVEIRWASDGDPDDVVAPWPHSKQDERIGVHVERMGDGEIWMAIDPAGEGAERVVMWFHAKRKGVLEWTVSEVGY